MPPSGGEPRRSAGPGAAGAHGRDAQRSLVYAAEHAAFAPTLYSVPLGGEGPRSRAQRLEAVQALVGAVLAHPSWAAMGAGITLDAGPAPARLVRADARWVGASHRLEVTADGCAPHVVAHELAHAAVQGWAERGSRADAADPGHGPRFAARHLDVAGLVLGRTGRRLLARSYAAHGVRIDAGVTTQPAVPGTGLDGALRALAVARAMGAGGYRDA
ncbi:MAG: hypothetical protein IPM45_12675 [Acidimicrobiales bacterium]|nr:hypothetical protein [Acidimicrobiales bacterium]